MLFAGNSGSRKSTIAPLETRYMNEPSVQRCGDVAASDMVLLKIRREISQDLTRIRLLEAVASVSLA